MPRPLVLSNGRLYLAYDAHYQLRDLTWPHVGYPNHVNGERARFGVWCEGQLAWTDAPEWTVAMAYEPGCLVGVTTLTHHGWQIRLTITEAVDPDQPVHVRRIVAEDLAGRGRNIRVFLHAYLEIGQSDVGNTAFYWAAHDAIVNYRGEHAFLFGGRTESGGLSQYSMGIAKFQGLEGTWRDADDGELGMNPIAQGSVDFTARYDLDLAHGPATLWTWMHAAHHIDDLLPAPPASEMEVVIERARSSGHQCLATSEPKGFASLPESWRNLYQRSLLIMQANCDHGGAILAANDSDIMASNRAHYSYCWPRDGARIAEVMDQSGRPETARAFLLFARHLVRPHRQFFLQKYRPDGCIGASWHPWVHQGQPVVPFQEDETALTLSLLRSHFEATRDQLLLEDVWQHFGRGAAVAMLAHRDDQGMPLPSWDLWEERYDVHAFTTAATIRALEDASHLAQHLGDDFAPQLAEAAASMRAGFDAKFLDHERGVYLRRPRDTTVDSSVLAALLHLHADLSEGPARATYQLIVERLSLPTAIGGLARYENDYYHRASEWFTGNPWIISTLWAAQAEFRLGELEQATQRLDWCVARTTNTGLLAEQYHPETGAPLSVSPLTWSHAEFVGTIHDFLHATAVPS